MAEVIRSVSNPRAKWLKKLFSDTKFRRTEGVWVAEGVRLCEEVIAADLEVTLAVYTDGFEGERVEPLKKAIADRGVETFLVSKGVLKEASATKSPQGLALVFRPPQFTLEDIAATPGPVLILDQLRDPGNLGTIARSALAAGCVGIICTPSSVDPSNLKALRASMGAFFSLPIVTATDPAKTISILDRPVYATTGEGGLYPEDADLSTSFALVLGQEAEGISDEWKGHVNEGITIPMEAGVESLNVAMAASVILFEGARQRRLSKG